MNCRRLNRQKRVSIVLSLSLAISISFIFGSCSSNRRSGGRLNIDTPLPQLNSHGLYLTDYTDTLSSFGVLFLVNGDCSICLSKIITFEYIINKINPELDSLFSIIIVKTHAPYLFEYNMEKIEEKTSFKSSSPIFIDEHDYFNTEGLALSGSYDIIIFDKDFNIRFAESMPNDPKKFDQFLKRFGKEVAKMIK